MQHLKKNKFSDAFYSEKSIAQFFRLGAVIQTTHQNRMNTVEWGRKQQQQQQQPYDTNNKNGKTT